MKVDFVRIVNKMGTSDLASFLGFLMWDDDCAITQNAINMTDEDSLAFYNIVRSHLSNFPEDEVKELTEATGKEHAKAVVGSHLVDDDSGYTIDYLDIDIGKVGDEIWHNLASAYRVCKDSKPLRILLSHDHEDWSEVSTENL